MAADTERSSTTSIRSLVDDPDVGQHRARPRRTRACCTRSPWPPTTSARSSDEVGRIIKALRILARAAGSDRRHARRRRGARVAEHDGHRGVRPARAGRQDARTARGGLGRHDRRLPRDSVWTGCGSGSCRRPRWCATRACRVGATGPEGPALPVRRRSTASTTAEALRGTTVLARAADVPEIEDVFDPVGLRVIDEERGELGEVVDVIVTGANDVWVVEGPPSVRCSSRSSTTSCRRSTRRSGTARVRLLPGLIEDE